MENMTTPSLTKPATDVKRAQDKEQAQRLHLSSSPHIRHNESVPNIMLWVVIALIPALIASVVFFGMRALFLTVFQSLLQFLPNG